MSRKKAAEPRHPHRYQALIEKRRRGLSSAGQAVATHLIAHPEQLPFQTADSLARHLRVSAMTVGRTLRALGYKGMAELRAEMCAEMSNAAPWNRRRRGATKPPAMLKSLHRARALQAEIEAVEAVHAQSETAAWTQAIKHIARADRVFVAGFQTERGLAMAFADHLSYVRPGVHLLSIENRAFADLRTDAGASSCVVMIDCRRYSRWFRLLGGKVSSLGVPLVIATDIYCDWAATLTPCVLQVRTDSGRFWANHAPLASLLNLLIEDVIEQLGDAIHARLDATTEFASTFVGFERLRRPRKPPLKKLRRAPA